MLKFIESKRLFKKYKIMNIKGCFRVLEGLKGA